MQSGMANNSVVMILFMCLGVGKKAALSSGEVITAYVG